MIELRVFEGEDDDLRDITVAYHNVNFFLFATLEQRPVAAGRIHAPGPPSVAVLNGCNVAGINYLERPSPAGYFIFPDLSVRHEGYYRLTFGLFEQVKDPRDADIDNPFPTQDLTGTGDQGGKPPKHNASVQRLEVRSQEFQVFSAKKFPGLDRSTGLSIGLSDQGCRVRIRRDVRMRKRAKPKPSDQQMGGDLSRGRYGAQDGTPMPHDRARSGSHCSRDGSQYGERPLSIHSNDHYSHGPAPALTPAAPMVGQGFTMPGTPTSSLPPAGPYAPQSAYPSPVAPAPSRGHEYAQPPSPYRPYEHRPSDASTVYGPPVHDTRRTSDASSYHRPSDASIYRPHEQSAYRPQEPVYRAPESSLYRPEPVHYQHQSSSYHSSGPNDGRNHSAHYSYGPGSHRNTLVPEKPLLPPVRDLLNSSDMLHSEQNGKRALNTPSYDDSLKRGMRPNLDYEPEEKPFPGLLEYKRANGTTSHVPGAQNF